MSSTHPSAVIVLAAGEGTRMKSAHPKVLHTLAGRTMLHHVVRTARSTEADRIVVVARYMRDEIAAHLGDIAPDALIADQDDIPGTGRAVQCALSVLDAVSAAGAAAGQDSPSILEGPVVVTSGDVPLLDAGTLRELVDNHVEEGNAVTLLSTRLSDPSGYGRIIRDPSSGNVRKIVEQRDASPDEAAIDEINGGVYVFDAAVLRDLLPLLTRDNDQAQLYLTDVIALAVERSLPVRAIMTDDPWLVEGVNDRLQLAQMRLELNRRILTELMLSGVTIVDPSTTWIDIDVDVAPDVTILPGVQLQGATSVDTGAVIGPDSTLSDMEIGEHATVIRTHGSLSVIGPNATVGPFAYLRPKTIINDGGKVGTFVETKNSEIGPDAKVPHLSYVGDATIGEGTNIGAGTIFANYDGIEKRRSTIGSYARTGSDNIFVAPVTVGDGAYTGAGTTVRHDVPPGALALSGGHQRNIEEWVIQRRPDTDSANAALSALEEPGAGGRSAQAEEEMRKHHNKDESDKQS